MSAVARYRWTAAVLLVSLVVRCVIVPITHGPDFIVWDLASQATLHGVNIYAHHPAGYPGGPFAYPPLFLYLEVPFQWLALHTGASFTILGKIPIVAGDLLTGTLIAMTVAERTHSDRRTTVAAAAWLLNPLVLYNGAFYGRFDSVCAGLYLLSLRVHDRERRWTTWALLAYSTAVATKIYPAFLLPWLWTRARGIRGRLAATVTAVVGGLSLPYLATSPGAFLYDVMIRNLGRDPAGLSWLVILLRFWPPVVVWLVGAFLLLIFVRRLFHLADMNPSEAALMGLLLFFLCSKLLLEQYFVWVFPFLILNAATSESRGDARLLTVMSVAGMFANHHIHPFGESVMVLNVSVAIAILVYVATRRRSPITVAPAIERTND